MAGYPVFLMVAALTVLSPGPGVLFTIGNAVNHGLSGALAGSLGVAAGALLVAGLSATGVGLVLSSSDLAFTVMKYAGAAYLLYLGGTLLRTTGGKIPKADPEVNPEADQDEDKGGRGRGTMGEPLRRGMEGLTLQLTNPKAVFFFVSVFPQFITPGAGAAQQAVGLVLTYAALVVVIHMGYAVCAGQMQGMLATTTGRRWVNRCSGCVFLVFGALMMMAHR